MQERLELDLRNIIIKHARQHKPDINPEAFEGADEEAIIKDLDALFRINYTFTDRDFDNLVLEIGSYINGKRPRV